MYRVKNMLRTRSSIALLALAAAGFGSIAGNQAQAQEDPNCRSFSHYPGAVTVVGIAKGTADEGDFRDCRVMYECGENARRLEVFAFGVSNKRDAVLAAESYAIATDGSEAILSSCEAAPVPGRATRACLAEPAEFISETAIAEEAECTVVVGVPPRGRMVGTATCFCEE